MGEVLFIFGADSFENIGVGQEVKAIFDGERFGVHLGVIESHFYIHMSEIAAMVTLLDAEIFTVRMADYIEPGLVVEASRLHHQRVAFPMPRGVAEPGGLDDFFGKRATVGVDLAMGPVGFVRMTSSRGD